MPKRVVPKAEEVRSQKSKDKEQKTKDQDEDKRPSNGLRQNAAPDPDELLDLFEDGGERGVLLRQDSA